MAGCNGCQCGHHHVPQQCQNLEQICLVRITKSQSLIMLIKIKSCIHFSKHGRVAWRQKKVLYYRSLQVLIRIFSEAYSKVALPGQEFAVFFGGIICFYATIKFYGIVHILVYLTMPISLLILLCFEELFHWGAAS